MKLKGNIPSSLPLLEPDLLYQSLSENEQPSVFQSRAFRTVLSGEHSLVVRSGMLQPEEGIVVLLVAIAHSRFQENGPTN